MGLLFRATLAKQARIDGVAIFIVQKAPLPVRFTEFTFLGKREFCECVYSVNCSSFVPRRPGTKSMRHLILLHVQALFFLHTV